MKLFTSRHQAQEVELPAAEAAGPPAEPSRASQRWGMLHRSGANFVTVGIGGIAGYISWLHLYALGTSQPLTPGLSTQQEHTVAALTPFSIDGLILAGTLKLREARLAGHPAHWAAYLAVLLGVGLTLAGNIASAPDALWARVLAAAPPAAFLISVEVLAGKPLTRNLWEIIRDLWHRSRKPKEKAEKAPATEKPAKAPEKPAEATTPQTVPTPPAPRPTPATRKHVGRAEGKRPTAPVTGTKTRPARQVGDKVIEGEELRADARERIRRALAAGRKRDGLGAWVAREYIPPMSDRWGLERVAEIEAVPVLDESAVPEPEAELADAHADLDRELAELG